MEGGALDLDTTIDANYDDDRPCQERAVSESVSIRPLRIERISVEIVGRTPLIVHNWDEKAKQEMREKGDPNRPPKKREKRDPEAAYQASRYLLPDGTDGFPAVAFKAAIADAFRFFEGSGVKKVNLKQSVFIVGEGPSQLVRINGAPEMREDMVRVGMGATDLRWRAQFWPWSVVLDIEHMPSMIGAEALVNIINAAGYGGVGEWRPSAPKSATGSYGMFEVKTEEVA